MHIESIIKTTSVSSWKKLFFQRVRWASKSTEYISLFGRITAITVFITNLSWVLLLLLVIYKPITTNHFITFTSIKFLMDLILLLQTSFYFKTSLRWIFIGLFLYPIFSTTVAIYSLFGSYTWKDRTFKK